MTGKHRYLWRAVDQDDEFVDVYLRERRDARTAKRFFRCLLTAGGMPREIVTDKLRSYGVAHRSLMPSCRHNTDQYANNRAELSHQPTRVRERGMKRFVFITHAQRFLGTLASVYNLFNLHRQLLSRRLFTYGELGLSKLGVRLLRNSALKAAQSLLGRV